MTGSERVSRRAPDAAADLDAGDQRQHPVEQHEIGLALGDLHECLLAVAGLADLEALLFEIVAQHRDERRLVFDDQDERLCHCAAAARRDDFEARNVAFRPDLPPAVFHLPDSTDFRRYWSRDRRSARCSSP